MTRRIEPRPTRVPPHEFEPDDTIPLDFWDRATCKRCCVVGRSGDDRHPVSAVQRYTPTPDEVRSAELRRLGERPDQEDDD